MSKILFVVGAGASCEVGLPSGDALKGKIAGVLNFNFDTFGGESRSGDQIILQCLFAKAKDEANRGDINPYVNACWRIRDAMLQAVSIDNFIDQQADPKIEFCGKLAIVRTILQSERDSRQLYIDRHNPPRSKLNHKQLQATWYNRFWQLITSNCKASDLAERLRSIAMVVFNYDRCIEHYLYNSLQTYYGITDQDAAALVNSMEIYHPYGTVGSLPWQGKPNHKSEFGSDLNPGTLRNLSTQIKTFTEGTDPSSSEICSIRDRMSDAEKIVFLGFAFHRQNLDLLWPGSSKTPLPVENRKCFATTYGLSKSSTSVVRDLIANRANVTLQDTYIGLDLKCFEIFHEFSFSLSVG